MKSRRELTNWSSCGMDSVGRDREGCKALVNTRVKVSGATAPRPLPTFYGGAYCSGHPRPDLSPPYPGGLLVIDVARTIPRTISRTLTRTNPLVARIIVAAPQIARAQTGAKKALSVDDYTKWKSIGNQSISGDGK